MWFVTLFVHLSIVNFSSKLFGTHLEVHEHTYMCMLLGISFRIEERLEMHSGEESSSSGHFKPVHVGHLQLSTVLNFAVRIPYSVLYTCACFSLVTVCIVM